MTKSITPLSSMIFCFCLSLILVSFASPLKHGKAVGEATTSDSRMEITSVLQVGISPNDIAYDKNSNTLFASVPASASSYANRIVFIDVPSGSVSSSIFVGNNPNRLAVAEDGSFLYVGLDANGAVKRVNLQTGVVDLEFFLGSSSCGLFIVEDLVILKDNPETVVIARRNTGCSPRHEGVAVYDNGIMRPTVTGDFDGNNEIEPSGDDSTIYGYDSEKSGTLGFGFRHLTITEQGIEIESLTTGILDGFSTTIKYHENYIYASNGTVVDPANDTVHANLEVEGPVSANPDTNQLLYFSKLGGEQYGFKIFDVNTLQQVASIVSHDFLGDSPIKLESLPPEHLALLTFQRKLYIIEIKEFAYVDYFPLVMHDFCGVPIQDDFSSSFSGWPVINTGDYKTGYVNGEYQIYHTLSNRWVAVTRGENWNNSKLVQIDGRLQSGDGVWGILFGLNDSWTDFYTFEILPNQQTWAVFRYQSANGWSLLANSISDSIKPGTAVNNLSMSQSYGNLELAINDIGVHFMAPKNGRIGLTGGSFTQNTDLRFDNYLFVDEKCPIPEQSANAYLVKNLDQSIMLERPNIGELLPENEIGPKR